MGSASCGNDQTYQTRFKNKYEFISLVNDHNFGEVKIYRKKQLNFDYVMVLHKYIQRSKLNAIVKQIQTIHAAFLKQNQPMALRIFNFEVDDGQVSNCSLCLIKIYVQYFNFTLHDLIQAHIQKGDSFTYEQLTYISNSCIITYQQFLNLINKNLPLTTKSIYISPQGCMKFCPIRPQQFFQHANPICNNFCNQTVYKEITNFERGQKYLLTQLRKIFSQVQGLNYDSNPESKKIYELFERIKKCQTIEMLNHKIQLSKIQSLNLLQKTEGSTVQQNKPESRAAKQNSRLSKVPNSFSEASEKLKTIQSESVKLSLTKNNQ